MTTHIVWMWDDNADNFMYCLTTVADDDKALYWSLAAGWTTDYALAFVLRYEETMAVERLGIAEYLPSKDGNQIWEPLYRIIPLYDK